MTDKAKAAPKTTAHPDHVKELLKDAGPDVVYDPVDDYPVRPYEQAKADG